MNGSPQPATPNRPSRRRFKRRSLEHFEPGLLERQLRIDSAIRIVTMASIGVCFVTAWSLDTSGSHVSFFLVILFLLVWYALNRISVQAIQQLPALTALIDQDPAEAERRLEAALDRRPMQQAIRLLLYHRLAVLRHRQGRYAQAAAIATTVLSQQGRALRALDSTGEMGIRGTDSDGAGTIQVHLLLLMVDCRLRCGDLVGAYWGLVDLQRMRLTIVDLLQVLTLQTRYEMATGHTAAALRQIEQKMKLFELLPATECGVMNALLSIAAKVQHQYPLARRLQQRARLMCTAEQFTALMATNTSKHEPSASGNTSST